MFQNIQTKIGFKVADLISFMNLKIQKFSKNDFDLVINNFIRKSSVLPVFVINDPLVHFGTFNYLSDVVINFELKEGSAYFELLRKKKLIAKWDYFNPDELHTGLNLDITFGEREEFISICLEMDDFLNELYEKSMNLQ